MLPSGIPPVAEARCVGAAADAIRCGAAGPVGAGAAVAEPGVTLFAAATEATLLTVVPPAAETAGRRCAVAAVSGGVAAISAGVVLAVPRGARPETAGSGRVAVTVREPASGGAGGAVAETAGLAAGLAAVTGGAVASGATALRFTEATGTPVAGIAGAETTAGRGAGTAPGRGPVGTWVAARTIVRAAVSGAGGRLGIRH